MKERSYKLIQGDMKKGNAKEYSVENGKHREMLVSISEGVPEDYKGEPYKADGRIVSLPGFPEPEYESFGYGEILVALDNEKYYSYR